nr:uncharacterized protein LOC109418020 [Aedes albopictus]
MNRNRTVRIHCRSSSSFSQAAPAAVANSFASSIPRYSAAADAQPPARYLYNQISKHQHSTGSLRPFFDTKTARKVILDQYFLMTGPFIQTFLSNGSATHLPPIISGQWYNLVKFIIIL